MKKEEIYAAILDTVNNSSTINPNAANDFLLGSMPAGSPEFERIMELIAAHGYPPQDLQAALIEVRIIVGLQAVLRKFRATKNEAFYLLRLVALMLENAETGRTLLNHIACLVDTQLPEKHDENHDATVTW